MREGGAVVREGSWTAWPVYWSPVIVGALASVVAVVLFGVIGTAVGSWKAGNEGRVTDFSGVGRVAVAYAVFASFFAFVIGGWVTARTAGIRRAEPAILHAAIAFLVATVALLAMASAMREKSTAATRPASAPTKTEPQLRCHPVQLASQP